MTNKKCVAYMRYSSDNQTQNSIEYQRAAIKKYCENHSLTLVREYVDEAYTGTTDGRPALQQMMTDAKSKPTWGTVLIYDLSRLFRNVSLAIRYRAILSDHDIEIVSVTEGFSNSSGGEMITTFIDLINAQQSKDNAKKTHAGMMVKALKGIHCGGIPPLGYDVGDDQRLVINNAEADVVREIFSLYSTGYPYQKMADLLNDKKICTKAGKPFTKNSFYGILTQEKYIGIYRWNKRKHKNSDGKHNNHAYKPVEQQVVCENKIPAIISKELFDKVQKKLAGNRGGKSACKSRHNYILGGMQLVKCEHCGSYMTGKIVTSHGRKYKTYACPNHKRGNCPTKDISAPPLDKLASAILAKELITKKNLPNINRLIRCGKDNEAVRQLNGRLTSVDKRIANVVKSVESSGSSVLADRLARLEAEKKAITEQLNEASSCVPRITEDTKILVRKKLAKYLSTANTPETREVFKSGIAEIEVGSENVTVRLRF